MKIDILKTRDTMTADILTRLAAARDTQLAMRAMGTVIVSMAQRAFNEAGLRPSSWAPLAASTLKQRRQQGRGSAPLMRSGLLSRSPRVGQVSSSSVTVVSDRPYAAYQQLGTKRAPARPFFPFYSDGRPTPKAQALLLSAADRALGLR